MLPWAQRLNHSCSSMKATAAAAAKSLQSCPTLCDPIDSSPPGFRVPGILQARTLEWVAISFSNAWKWKVKVKSLSRVPLFETPWTAAYQAPPSMGFSRQEHWSGVPLPSPLSATKHSTYHLHLAIGTITQNTMARSLAKTEKRECQNSVKPVLLNVNLNWMSPNKGPAPKCNHLWAYLLTHTVKNWPAVWETGVRPLGWEDSLEEGMAIHSSILARRIPKDREAWRATVHGVIKSWTQLSTTWR